RQVVYDSRQWRDVRGGFLALAPLLGQRRLDLADLNWRRLAPVRQALVHAGGAVTFDDLCRASGAIVHRPGEDPPGWLLLGWLEARMEWRGPAASDVREDSSAEDLMRVRIVSERTTLTIALTERRVQIQHGDAAPFTMAIPAHGEADTVASELRSLA